MTAGLLALAILSFGLAGVLGVRLIRARREAFVRSYMFPPGLLDAFGKKHPGLDLKDRQLVARALRQFFLAYLKGGRRHASMPSQVADDLWHEFILYTRNYQDFCRRSFGGFLHHAPAVVLGPDRQNNAGLRRVWWHACLEENISPRKPTRLPLLFALDRKLGVAGGFVYTLDCDALRRQTANGSATVIHCGADFGSTSFDGSTDGFGDWGGDGGAFGGAGGSGDGGADGGGGGCSGGCSGSD
jgi:hypothetical protein